MFSVLDRVNLNARSKVATRLGLQVGFQQRDTLVVPNQHQRAPDRPQHVGEVALEQSLHSLVFNDLLPAVHGSPGEDKVRCC